MRVIKSDESLKNILIISVMILVAITIVLYSNMNYGVGLSPDSSSYIAAARNISIGEGFTDQFGKQINFWPPIYPAILATIKILFNVDPIKSSNILNAVLFGLIIVLTYFFLKKHLNKHTLLTLVGLIIVVFSMPLIQVTTMAWSEPLFISLVLAYLITIEKYLIRPGILSIILLAFIVALSSLTRYIGVILILSGMISIIFFLVENVFKKFVHLIIFLVISGLPLLIWIIRNYYITGSGLGPRTTSIYSFGQNIDYFITTCLSWYLPAKIAQSKFSQIPILLAVGVFILFNWQCYWKNKNKILFQIRSILLFIILYSGFIILSATTTSLDQIDNRLLSPIFIPVNLILLILIVQIFDSNETNKINKVFRFLIVISLIVCLIIFPVRATLRVKRINEQGQGYSDKNWMQSEIIKELLHIRIQNNGKKIFSNDPDALYILANLNAHLSPSTSGIYSVISDKSDLARIWPPDEEKVYLIWFQNVNLRTELYELFPLKELLGNVKVECVKKFKDGYIYLMKKNNNKIE